MLGRNLMMVVERTMGSNSTIESIKIFLTMNCKLRCSYCLLDLKDEVIIPEVLDKILAWSIKNNIKSVGFFGGEPSSSFNLIVRAAKFLRRHVGSDIKIDAIPTNGAELSKKNIYLARNLNIEFDFSLDGLDFEDNYSRQKSKHVYHKIIDNLAYYKKLYGVPPKIKMTVQPEVAHLLHKNVLSFINKGYTRVQIRLVNGYDCWTDKYKDAFLESFDKLLIIHKRLKGKLKNFVIDPIDWHYQAIKNENFENISGVDCSLGTNVSFDVKGRASACLSIGQLSDGRPLKNNYMLGDVDSGVDLTKMRMFKDYTVHSEFAVNEKYKFPNISAKKVCSTFDFKTGERKEIKYIENYLGIEYQMFEKTLNAYFPDKSLLALRERSCSVNTK